ncbi:MAG TPA: sulfotransferase [Caulobacteraceae bacterium]|nr:sulfotransferase [Caulobacteraceae bacterium]
MGLKVIGAGLPRTGTLSMKHALEQLGFGRCYHMEEVFADHARSRAWASYFTGGPVDWDEVFDGYGAAVDAPAYIAWRDLIRAYPDAKVVLTMRDADSWYDSMSKTILSDGLNEALMATELGPMLAPMLGAMLAEVPGLPPMQGPPAGPPPREVMMAMREAHNTAVLREVPPERLLVFQVSEGWEPLCRFLGVETPVEAFPRVNDAGSFHATFGLDQASA